MDKNAVIYGGGEAIASAVARAFYSNSIIKDGGCGRLKLRATTSQEACR